MGMTVKRLREKLDSVHPNSKPEIKVVLMPSMTAAQMRRYLEGAEDEWEVMLSLSWPGAEIVGMKRTEEAE